MKNLFLLSISIHVQILTYILIEKLTHLHYKVLLLVNVIWFSLPLTYMGFQMKTQVKRKIMLYPITTFSWTWSKEKHITHVPKSKLRHISKLKAHVFGIDFNFCQPNCIGIPAKHSCASSEKIITDFPSVVSG